MVDISFDPTLTNLTTPSWDSFIILFYLIAVVIYSFFASRERLTVVLVSIYSSLALILGTPYLQELLIGIKPDEQFLYKLGSFIVGFLLLYILFSRNMSLRAEVGHSWWQALIISCLQVGLLMSCILTFLPASQLGSEVATQFFTSDIPRSFWMLAPVFVMLLMRNKEMN